MKTPFVIAFVLALAPSPSARTLADASVSDETLVRLDFSRPADWMARNESLLASRPLSQVILPGSHDAASYSLGPLSGVCPSRIHPLAALGSFLMAPLARTQDVPVDAQLEGGVRYLDLRVCAVQGSEGRTFYMHHTYLGAPLEEVLGQIERFTRAHRREIVILDFQHLNGLGESDRRLLGRDLEERFGSRMLSAEIDPGASTLGELWARGATLVVLMARAPSSGRVFDRSDTLESMWVNAKSVSALRSAVGSIAALESGRLQVLQWQLTPGAREMLSHPGSTLRDFAGGPNRLIVDGTLRKLLPPKTMNVVMTDDAVAVAESIARLNEVR